MDDSPFSAKGAKDVKGRGNYREEAITSLIVLQVAADEEFSGVETNFGWLADSFNVHPCVGRRDHMRLRKQCKLCQYSAIDAVDLSCPTQMKDNGHLFSTAIPAFDQCWSRIANVFWNGTCHLELISNNESGFSAPFKETA